MPKCPYSSGVRIKRALRKQKKNVSDLRFINTKTKAGIFGEVNNLRAEKEILLACVSLASRDRQK